jgi:hypothetical protein
MELHGGDDRRRPRRGVLIEGCAGIGNRIANRLLADG